MIRSGVLGRPDIFRLSKHAPEFAPQYAVEAVGARPRADRERRSAGRVSASACASPRRLRPGARPLRRARALDAVRRLARGLRPAPLARLAARAGSDLECELAAGGDRRAPRLGLDVLEAGQA